MAIVWLLKDRRVTSVLIGASSVEQLHDNLAALNNPDFSRDELERIEKVLENRDEPAWPAGRGRGTRDE